MDIGIVSNFVDEFSGGIGVYTHEILKNLYRMDPFRKVITVHDLGPLILPELFKNGDVLLHRLLLKKTIQKADKIITVSYNSQKDLMDYLNVPEEDIEVIYNGVDEFYQSLDEEEVWEFKERSNLPDHFILTVGGLHPIKNLPRLLQAYYLARKNGLEHKLVVVGGIIDRAQEIFETLRILHLEKDVIFTGAVPKKD
ncbi:MAG: glycosyltransferase, partial [Methanobacterium sp.]|nr:glycosyltransferase [Methanobacterium sp.]